MAAFMEVLDTSIANVALPYIAGGLAASNESEYLGTYVVPCGECRCSSDQRMAGGPVRPKAFLYPLYPSLYASSVLCGFAPNLGMLILFRALQGAGGGGLQPMAQAILADTFPPQKRGLAFALYGITAVIGAHDRPNPRRLDYL